MSTFREKMMQTAMAVISGSRQGDINAAKIALEISTWVTTRDLILGVTTSDEDLNAEIVATIKARKS